MKFAKRERLLAVQERIRTACASSGRSVEDVTLVAVSKTKPWQDIADFADLGLKDFGENYVQEALAKQASAEVAAKHGLRWHLIGTLQSNKAKFVPGNFHLFHGLDSAALAERMNRLCAEKNVVQDCLLEVNLDFETTKGGIPAMDLPDALEVLNGLKNLRILGLMCIPAPGRDTRPAFSKLRELLDDLNVSGAYREPLRELSMGMSSDFEAAIQEGATLVRLGTVLFGEREQH
jgi:PLP dependent protein